MKEEILTEMLEMAITFMVENEACVHCAFSGTEDCQMNLTEDICYSGIWNWLESKAKKNIRKVS